MAPPGTSGMGPPQTTMRPGSMMGGPGQGMGGMVPPGTRQGMATRGGGTRAGPPGSRQGTAAQVPLGVGAMTEVTVAERPMTQQGLSGMKTGSLGPKRQIYDKTYYMLELRKRSTELAEEVAKMNTEVEDARKDNQLYANLEKRYDSLVKTVRELEGDLADHNLTSDKLRTDTQPAEVHHMFMIMKQQNDQQRNEVDQVFLEKRSHEEELQRMQSEMTALGRAVEERLNELHPEQHEEYLKLRQENETLNNDLFEGREELEQVSNRLIVLEGHLRSDMLRTRMQELVAERDEVCERLDAVEAEARQCSLSVPEQRELLLAKVKTDNAEIVAAEKKNSDLRMEKEKLKIQIQDIASDAKEQKNDSDQQKYEILFAKDQEMTQFIDSFDEPKAEAENKMQEKQESITQILVNISKAINLTGGGVALDGHLRDMEDELDFKNKQLQNSETTQSRLEAELQKRQGEVEKIEHLDAKISVELEQTEAKTKQYEEEIEQKFDRVDEMRHEGTERLKVFEVRKKAMETRLAALKQQLGFLKLRHESKRQQLADNEAATSLDNHEQKIKQYGQNVNALKTFINQKTAETDFSSESATCFDIANTLNKLLLEQR
eukprot:TRINITY_DN69634_c0_g1_i1.p1 TRINITY_DN69634_c0_g1~~TRINITY_DN69634_c0_g1_i1.p1  ORF type:complete len:677 (+),score=184.54 TRINITY_DN69634_c0_g1_i1:217-2031(+)